MDWVNALIGELRATIDYYLPEQDFQQPKFQEILLCGGGAGLLGLAPLIEQKLKVKTLVAGLTEKFILASKSGIKTN